MTKFIIFWWAETEKKIFGHDVIEINQDSLSEDEAEKILEYNAYLPDRKYIYLPSFSEKYLNADICKNFGIRKIVKTKKNRRDS